MNLTEKIFSAAQHGADAILYFLILTSVLSIAMILERFFALKTHRQQSEKIRKLVEDALRTNSLEDLESMAKDKDSIEGQALAAAFRHYKDKGVSGAEDIFSSYVTLQRPLLEKSLNILATIGSNAPFVGLLGTVLGIMKAFNDLGVSQGDPSKVMIGIAEALVATAVGLFVAIPATIAYNSYQKQVRGIMQSTDSLREVFVAWVKTSPKVKS